MLETTKNKKIQEEGETNTTIADIKSNINRNKSGGIKNTTNNNTTSTSMYFMWYLLFIITWPAWWYNPHT